MAKIQRLDAHLTNMIAAGEVVERPMGVVKELIENSIDAQAKNIEIHIKEGGLNEINIIDDGHGMSAADASLAFERHATSKLYHVNDLWKITTMGFRGEALPSIASVSHTYLKTNDGNESTEIEIKYGVLVKAQAVGASKGTQIIVKNLFQKTPARLKHLKTPQYEFSLISDVVQKFALARSDIAFSLNHDDKQVFSTTGRGNMQEVIMAIYGRDVAKLAIPINSSDHDYYIEGYAIQPSQTRASKYYMLLYINQRMIRSYRLQKAIMDAYAPFIASDRYPIVILNIKTDPKLVDVNVHPSKWEVRLSKERQIENLIKQSIGDALHTKMEVNKVERKTKDVITAPKFDFTYQMETVEPILKEVREEFATYQEEHKEETIVVKEAVNDMVETPIVEDQKSTFPFMEVIGQMHDSYILAQGEQGLYIIDQHAAQERYHYEQLQELLLKGIKDTQPLLVPITIESSLTAVVQIDEINALLNGIGIQLEAFGNHTFIVRSLPIWVCDVEEEKFIQDMIDIYLKNKEVKLDQLRKNALASMACHSSIRFNRKLSLQEMQQVIKDLKKCNQPYHCPHGRPTFIELTLKTLEKDFYRVK